MKELKITTQFAEAEGTTVYALHESGIYRKGEMEMCNRFYATVYPDYARGATIEEAEANADLFAEALNVANECGLSPRELLEQRNKYKQALEEILHACGTVNFSSHTQMREAIETALELAEINLQQ